MLLATTFSRGQSSEPASAKALIAQFVPGESVRYEFEGLVHASSGHARNVTLSVPDDCSYRLRAVLKFDFDAVSAGGGLSGRVHFQAVRYDGQACAIPEKSDLAKALQNLEASEIKFDITPAGDARLSRAPAAAESEGVSVLLKAAWDLLQVRLSDKAISPGPASFPSRHFLYWPDTFVEDMEVAAASMQYPRDATIAGRPYAWLQYRQVFSPTDVPAYIEARTQARDFTGTAFITGKGRVSLLFDGANGRVVYLQRNRTIDNRTALKYDASETSIPLATYSLAEESTVRWLPDKNAEAWLAELHKFESEPVEERSETGSSDRRRSRILTGGLGGCLPPGQGGRGNGRARNEISESLDLVPRGFERWQNTYCSGGYCFDLSIAVPEQTREVERRDGTVLLLSGSGERTVTVAVGPMLDLQYEGLSEDELLKQQTTRFVANYLWFTGSSGRKLNFESSSLQDRPAAFSDFTATARDLAPIRGRLVMVIGPYGRLAPLTCSYAIAQQQALDAICQTVAGSVVIH